jgi:hypothetical protein
MSAQNAPRLLIWIKQSMRKRDQTVVGHAAFDLHQKADGADASILRTSISKDRFDG